MPDLLVNIFRDQVGSLSVEFFEGCYAHGLQESNILNFDLIRSGLGRGETFESSYPTDDPTKGYVLLSAIHFRHAVTMVT